MEWSNVKLEQYIRLTECENRMDVEYIYEVYCILYGDNCDPSIDDLVLFSNDMMNMIDNKIDLSEIKYDYEYSGVLSHIESDPGKYKMSTLKKIRNCKDDLYYLIDALLIIDGNCDRRTYIMNMNMVDVINIYSYYRYVLCSIIGLGDK